MDSNISTTTLAIVITIVIWEMIWKGIALWRASQNKQLGWFVAIFVINTIGILPILYLIMTRRTDRAD